MPKVQLDLQKFAIISAGVSGIGLLLWKITDICADAIFSIVKNQLFDDGYKMQARETYNEMKDPPVEPERYPAEEPG